MSTSAEPTQARYGRPGDAEELSALLAQATAEGQPLTPWGAGTRQHIGGPPLESARRLELGALDRVIDYVPEDLTLTLQGGVTIGAAQALLAERGQLLPWDPPGGPQATIGGLLASGAGGPLRLGAGTPRDWVLGMQVALGDGRLARSGSRVVKNVAGYDLHKLHLGALGTLGVIVETTLKVLPLPERQAALLAGFASLASALEAAEQLRAAPLAPLALALLTRKSAQIHPLLADFTTCEDSFFVLLARFGGTLAAVNRQMRLSVQRCEQHGAACLELAEADGIAAWRALPALHEPGEDLLLRCGHPPAALQAALAALDIGSAEQRLIALPGAGLAWLRAPANTSSTRLAALRHSLLPLEAYLVVEDAPDAPGAAIDRWGPAPPGIALMRQLKRQWDPAGILNHGRYLVDT
jgi:glycolate oxidase FAD binding subunit